MILDFRLTTDGKVIRATAPEAEFEAEILNIAGYHEKTKAIVSIGDTAEDMKRNAPEYWERNGQQIRFVHPLSFDKPHPATGQFEPLFAARIVAYLAEKAFQRMKRQGALRLLISPWVDRVDYTLDLPGFDRLPPETRRQFIKHVKNLVVSYRYIRINGELVGRR